MISDKWKRCSAERYLELYEWGSTFPYHDSGAFLVEEPYDARLCSRIGKQAYTYRGCAIRNGVHYETLVPMTVAEFEASLKYDLPQQWPYEMLCRSQLCERGWTQDLIRAFLGDPDSMRASPLDEGFPSGWYEEERVKRAEASHEWIMAQHEMARRRGEIKVPVRKEKPVLRYAVKQFRRIATRYEKRVTNYLAMLHVGMIVLWP